MTKVTIVRRVLTPLLILLVAGSVVFADTIRLKDGSIIKGKIVRFGGGTFTVVVGEGQRRRELSFSAEEIETIQFEGIPSATATNSRSSESNVNTVPVRSDRNSDRVGVVTTGTANRSAPAPAAAENAPARQPVAKQQTASGKPIELVVKVLADNTANGWTNSGWVVKKGQKIRITGSGEILLGAGRKSSPSGFESEDGSKLLQVAPTGCLIAVIGDDNNDFIWIGAEREFVAARDGALFLGVNEGNLDDNSGSYDVKIQILPGGE